jgi:hypothetical protein
VANPNVYSGGSWTKNTGVTVAADSGDVADPAGSNVEDKLSYDGSGVANDYRINQGLLAPSANGTKYTMSFWARLLSGSRAMFGSQNITEVAAAITSTWTRFANTGTGDGATNLQHRLDDGVALNSAFSCYLFGSQSEVGAYPSSFIVGARAADVLTVAAPAQIARGGFFDISLVVAPHYTQAEQAADHNLVYFGSNDRAFIRQSDHKVVLRIGGADVVSSALTWSRNQALTVRVRHLASGRTLTVSGATSGSGSTTGVAVSAITLPATAYLLGGATGAEESADLQALTVATTVRDR